jgi:hypothetical protein
MKTQCPKCSYVFEVVTRARLGEGTQKGKFIKNINENKQNILNIMNEEHLTAKQVQGKLYALKIKRLRRGDKIASGEWNYHVVQAELSILVGAGLLKMSQESEEFWSDKEQKYKAKPIPKYWKEVSKNG